ncbi:hypothetical protein [Altererythrobacter lauratis]|uniref:DUF2927 domain-containing protein n=1 Tax=Alteraurantiacibacter lauratis TaxID=2054627 RepID=A0ABV7EGZ4_9SPHN
MLTRKSGLATLARMACLAALPLAPQAAAQDRADPIVVEADRQQLEVDGGEVRSQARAVTPRGAVLGEPLARFQDPICPGVWGLSAASAQYIIDRIYYNAEAAGIAVDLREGCAANVIVAFVDDPQAEFADMVAGRHQLVNGLSFDERKRVRETRGPVLAWNIVATRTRDGQDRDGRPPVFESTEISRLNAGTRRDMLASVIMLDTDLLEDLDGLALADYATMRTLARTRPVEQDAAAYRTVLSLFDDPVRAPQSLTDFDRAYLASLYSGRANQPGQLALRDIGNRMEAALPETP